MQTRIKELPTGSVTQLVVVVVSSSHQSPSLGVSRFGTAQSITILLSVWSASKGSRKGNGCHEANDRSCGNGCALTGLLNSCTEQGFGCDRCAVVPEQFSSSLAVSARLWQWAAVGHEAVLMSCFQWQ